MVAQIGFIDKYPKNIQWFSYLSFTEVLAYFERASMIIGHSGVGTVITAITYKKPLILVPRSSTYGEHFDDHQLELAMQLRGMEGIFVVDDIENLKTTVLEVRERVRQNLINPRFSEERQHLLEFIRNYVQEARASLKR